MTELVGAIYQIPCANPVAHQPRPHVLHRHHVLPVSWGGENGRIVLICGNCHDNVHEVLNHFVRAQARPPYAILRHYSTFIVGLAQEAWDKSTATRRPYTAGRTDP